jgi:hypothetical protein
MRLRHLLLSQWVFAVEKPIGRIVKRFFVVGEHSSVTRKGIVANTLIYEPLQFQQKIKPFTFNYLFFAFFDCCDGKQSTT